jgi:polyhydroxyalkanoate synthesis regulator phasin
MIETTNPNVTPKEVPVVQEPASSVQPTRMLAIAFKKSQMIREDDGLLVKDVPMLAAGTWTDSAVQTALNYPERTLSKYAANWSDMSGWARHAGSVPRDATDKVAELRNPRFQDGAVMGDIFIHGYTQKSRDMIELIKRRLISMVSVEHTGDERYNASTRQLEAETLSFSGFAFVNKGACKLCRINETPLVSASEAVAAPTAVQESTMEMEKLKAQVDELTRKLAEITTAPVNEPVVDNSALLAAQAQAQAANDKITTLEAQLKQVMSQPAPVVVAEKKIVEHVEPSVIHDRRNGTIRMN